MDESGGNYLVRRMCMRDLGEVEAIERECFSSPWTRQGFADALSCAENIFLLAQERRSKRIAGYCGLYKAADEGEITNVAVTADCRRQGIASALLSAMQREATLSGIAQIFLEVRVSNAAAIALYEKYSFAICARRRGFYRDPDEDAYVMSCRPGRGAEE